MNANKSSVWSTKGCLYLQWCNKLCSLDSRFCFGLGLLRLHRRAHWAAEYLLVKCAINDEVVVLGHNLSVVNRRIFSFQDGRICVKCLLSHLECQCCRCRCEKGYNNEGDIDFLVDGVARDHVLPHKVAAVRNSMHIALLKARDRG